MRAALFSLFFMSAPADAQQVNLSPPASQVEFRAYGLGLIPFDGKFARFHGVMRYDPVKPQSCQVMLEIDAASLEMSDASVRDQIIGPEFMDLARFPDMAFDGACQGETHPFALDVERSDGNLTATGRLKRADWGITARPFTAGSTIRIRVVFPAPGNGAHA
jgi:polyisoprenoid-binding protein YceI